MRTFVVRFLLGIAAAWIGSSLIPGIAADGALTTFILMGLFLAVGEMIIPLIESGAGVLLFFIPRSARLFLLRAGEVAVAASLVSGFGFVSPLIGIVGFTILLSLLYLLPLAA